MRAPGSRGRRARVVGLGVPEATARRLREPQHIRCRGRRRFPESLAGAIGGQRPHGAGEERAGSQVPCSWPGPSGLVAPGPGERDRRAADVGSCVRPAGP